MEYLKVLKFLLDLIKYSELFAGCLLNLPYPIKINCLYYFKKNLISKPFNFPILTDFSQVDNIFLSYPTIECEFLPLQFHLHAIR